jgi:hypothetical protein
MTETINFFLQWEEYFAAQEFFRRRRQAIAPEWGWGGLLILLGLILLFWAGLSIFAVDAVLIGLVVIFGVPIIRRWVSKRKWQREPLYHTEHEVGFSEDGVYFRMGHIESNLDWKYYQRLVENQDGLLLVYGNDSFNLLPKRAFADEKLIGDFRALAQKKLK